MGEDKVCFGLVVGLDYTDATFSVHDALQLFKTHPFIKDLLEGGKRVAWGAKTIPSGGYFAMPKRLSVPGMVVAGDAAGMVNIADPGGRPLRDARRDVRGGSDRRVAEAGLWSTSRPTTRRSTTR